MKRFKATFLKGFVFFIPTVFTIWVFNKIFRILYGFVAAGTHFFPGVYKEHAITRFLVETLLIFGTLLFIVLAGILAETFIGRFLRKIADSLLGAIPFVNSLHGVLKQISQILFLKNDELLARPVLVPFPHPGKIAIGFITGKAEPMLAEKSGKEYVKIFLPTVPIPTTGFLMIFPKDQVVENALSTEEALRLILSGGILDEKDGIPAELKTKVGGIGI
jgi:uncharacterized membrane protein